MAAPENASTISTSSDESVGEVNRKFFGFKGDPTMAMEASDHESISSDSSFQDDKNRLYIYNPSPASSVSSGIVK
jgi:hypothetical protein